MSDRPHRWARVINAPQEPRVVPHGLLEALAAEATEVLAVAAARPTPAAAAPGGDRAVDRARQYLAKLPPAIQGEDGSGRTFAAACGLVVGFDLSVEAALPLLTEYSDRCEPPWSEQELRHKLEDARTKAEEEPEKVGYRLRRSKDLTPEQLQAWSPFAGYAGDITRPAPIGADLRPVPPLPPNFLPEPFRDWLSDIAERAGCPLDYSAVAAIIAVATLVGRRVAIRPKRHDDWAVVPNLWGGVVGRPGVMKTTALREALRPLSRLAKEAEEKYQEELKAFEAQADLRKLQYEAVRKSYQSALNAKDRDEDRIAELAEQIQAPPDATPPARRRYVINDATVEKVVEIHRENPNGVLQSRDELVGFLRTLEQRGREADRTFYLEAWNGDIPFTSDRIGRGTVPVDAICISLLGGIQPGPLAEYIRAASGGTTRADDGLIGRFQLLVYPDIPGEWRNVDRYPDADAKNRAFEVFRRLATLDATAAGAEVDDSGDGSPFLRFADDAQDLFDDWPVLSATSFISGRGQSG